MRMEKLNEYTHILAEGIARQVDGKVRVFSGLRSNIALELKKLGIDASEFTDPRRPPKADWLILMCNHNDQYKILSKTSRDTRVISLYNPLFSAKGIRDSFSVGYIGKGVNIWDGSRSHPVDLVAYFYEFS